MTKLIKVCVDTIMAWAKIALKCANPLGLTEETLEETKEFAPPKVFKGGKYLGRYLVPDEFVRYDEKEQPRDKTNDPEHVNSLINSFTVNGYNLDANVPVAVLDKDNVSLHHLKGLSGFHRKAARSNYGQEIYIYDVYEFDSPYDEVIARNETNHHKNPHLSQTKEDYKKEVTNAIHNGIITSDADDISRFVDTIASDKTWKVRNWIKEQSFKNHQVFPNFRTYNSVGKKEGTLHSFFVNNGFAVQGVGKRTDEELIKQGYITYCATDGDNLQAWARGIKYSTLYNIPVWIFGYSSTRIPNLLKFRQGYITDFETMKETVVTFSFNVAAQGEVGEYNDEDVLIKLAGFLPQNVKVDPTNKGLPHETTLVDVSGNPIKFDPDGDCLTIR